MPPVTSHDVAKATGFSQMTVSRVLSGKGAVAPKTRERILEAVEQLGYRPNALASGLRGGVTQSIGLIVKGLGGSLATEHIRHLIHAAQEHSYLTYTFNIDHRGDDSDELIRVAQDLLDRRIDGLVVYRNMPASVKARRFLESCGIPVVFLGDWGPSRSRQRVVLDVKTSILQLADHLASLKHRRVAYFPSVNLADFPEHKLRPIQRSFAKVGIELVMDPKWWIKGQPSIAEATYQAVRSFLTDGPDVTALMIINDVGALGALAAVREAGLSVPEDLSIVGFDDMDGAGYCDPPLTTIGGPDSSHVGRAAFEMLHTLIATPDAVVERQSFPFELIVRESTGPASVNASKSKRR